MRTTLKVAFAASLVASAGLPAKAADLPSRVAAPVYVAPPSFTWTGLYIGANAGAAFGEHRGYYFPNSSITGSEGTDGFLSTRGGAGFTGGGQIGYNYQFAGSGIVAGVEADAAYLGMKHSGTYTFTPTTPLSYGLAFVPVPGLAPPTVFIRHSDFFGTARGRLGYAFDRALLYVTGGLAYNDVRFGYTVGGGLEYAFTNNWSVGAEVLYVNLDRSAFSTAVFDINANTVTIDGRSGRNDFVVARAKLNYKFDFGAPPPVVARY